MKKILLIVTLLIFSVSSNALAFKSNGEMTVPVAPGVKKSEMNEAMNRLTKKIKKETDWISVKQDRNQKSILSAIGEVSNGVQAEVQSAMTDIQKSAKEAIGGATGELVSATKDLRGVAEDMKKSTESTATAIDNIGSSMKNAVNGLGLVMIFIGAILFLGLIILGLAVIRNQKNGQAMIIKELRDGKMAEEVSEIKEEVSEIKGVVKPDSFTLHFIVAGQEWLYNVPVNKRGKFDSIYPLKIVDPADMPTTPAETVRATFTEEKDLLKSCKSALKEYLKPTCNSVQKNLIDHLISTGELRKA